MTRKRRVLFTALPFTPEEWRKGQRYILTNLTTAEVQIIYHHMRSGVEGVRTETHKVMDLRQKMPGVIRKLIPEDACVVDEYSTSLDTFALDKELGEEEKKNRGYEKIIIDIGNKEGALAHLSALIIEVPEDRSLSSCVTTYKNRYFNTNAFNLTIKTHILLQKSSKPFGPEEIKEKEIDFRSHKKQELEKVGTRDYSGNWMERYPVVYCYKLLDVSVNRFGFGWIANKVYDVLENMVIDVQQQVVKTYDEWSGMSELEIRVREEEMIRRLLANIEKRQAIEAKEQEDS